MLTLRTLPPALRVLFSSFLVTIGIGYIAAIAYLFLIDIQPHRQKAEGVVEGIAEKYHGSTSATRIEAALRGAMSGMVLPEEREQIIAWIHGGATEADFEKVKPIFQKCAGCHSPASGMKVPPLTSYEEVRAMADIDTGLSIVQLARVSHVHLFGISIIFLLTGTIFALSRVPLWLRVGLIVIPYLAIIADIGSWWLTKYEPLFASIVLIGGAFMGASLGLQILISLWDMWLAPGRARAPSPI
jgi:hypothetical protein